VNEDVVEAVRLVGAVRHRAALGRVAAEVFGLKKEDRLVGGMEQGKMF